MKVEKIQIENKTRKLAAKWTIDFESVDKTST